MIISSARLLEIYRQSLVRHPIFSQVSLLVRPWPYRVVPIAGETCGVCICSIACSHVISCCPRPTWASRQVSQHSQRQSLQVISFVAPVRSGRSVLLNKINCSETSASFSKKYGQGRNAWNLFTLKIIHNQSAPIIQANNIPFVPFQCPWSEEKKRPDRRTRVDDIRLSVLLAGLRVCFVQAVPTAFLAHSHYPLLPYAYSTQLALECHSFRNPLRS